MIYKTLIRPLLFTLEAETAHHISLSLLNILKSSGGRKILSSLFHYETPSLEVKAFGLTFHNPVGLAAGFDKNAHYLEALSLLGFGFVEIGTITFHPQPGNPKPRIKRIPDSKAVWNHLGFNNDGAAAVAERLKKIKLDIPVGINIGKSKIAPIENASEDYLSSFQILYPYGDYFVINVSSPNTPGLRELQKEENLSTLLNTIQKKNTELSSKAQNGPKPILVKISPDLTFQEIDSILTVIRETKAAGIIATNTTLSRTEVSAELPSEGGISGKPIKNRSTEIIRYIVQKTEKRTHLIGCGGIFTSEDAVEKIKAGASLVQLYTGLIYEGPGIVKRIKKELSKKSISP